MKKTKRKPENLMKKEYLESYDELKKISYRTSGEGTKEIKICV